MPLRNVIGSSNVNTYAAPGSGGFRINGATMHRRSLLIAISFVAAGSLAPTVAAAGPEICKADAKALCVTEVRARNREAAKACLVKNLDKVSAECRAAIRSQMKPPAPAR